ncbi:hypothetical protein N7491_003163 [Penicillium cf. griseofulvum]|uniref:Transcription factor domain-containing protein n=1 Tax=Penicillium cf. griseofulvum TaxID=2972120 RepID=A0A9W9MRK9_9EURO|nr:hypothetical protein N7472_002664 [Penicillium cf. griseofulvum]KAJ5440757.1 hypothetical protein N7491_003163 [Penicillium cf. griseofulvum]KAJ5448803.1 hypothetical protein N7445_003624 [Penicillium cf. griseofulvum]
MLISNQLYEGVRDHGFELHALLERASEFWINEESGFGAAEDVRLIRDIDNIHAAAVAVLFCLRLLGEVPCYSSGLKWQEAWSRVSLLIWSFPCAIVSTANPMDLAGQLFLHSILLMQRPAPLNSRPGGTSYPKIAQFAHRALENLRLDVNSNDGLPWYASVLSFRQTIQDLVKD